MKFTVSSSCFAYVKCQLYAFFLPLLVSLFVHLSVIDDWLRHFVFTFSILHLSLSLLHLKRLTSELSCIYQRYYFFRCLYPFPAHTYFNPSPSVAKLHLNGNALTVRNLIFLRKMFAFDLFRIYYRNNLTHNYVEQCWV